MLLLAQNSAAGCGSAYFICKSGGGGVNLLNLLLENTKQYFQLFRCSYNYGNNVVMNCNIIHGRHNLCDLYNIIIICFFPEAQAHYK